MRAIPDLSGSFVSSPTQTMPTPTSTLGRIVTAATDALGTILGQSGIGNWGLGGGGLTTGKVPTLKIPGLTSGRRRMNVLNPRALRRSMRRVQGFAKFARKTISFTQRVKMKKRRR